MKAAFVYIIKWKLIFNWLIVVNWWYECVVNKISLLFKYGAFNKSIVVFIIYSEVVHVILQPLKKLLVISGFLYRMQSMTTIPFKFDKVVLSKTVYDVASSWINVKWMLVVYTTRGSYCSICTCAQDNAHSMAINDKPAAISTHQCQ